MFLNQIKLKLWNRASKLFKRNSALFLNGPKATDTYAYVTPHIDFLEKLKDEKQLRKTIKIRQSEIDLDKTKKLWKFYEEILQAKIKLESSKNELSIKLNELMKSDPNSKDINSIKLQVSLAKEDLKNIKSKLWSIEEKAVLSVLNLPNYVHNRTPVSEPKIVYSYGTQPDIKLNHLEAGQNILSFKNSNKYYLKGEGALFELGAMFYLSKLLKEHCFIQFSNPDFVKSAIIEGCGTDYTDPKSTFVLGHNENTPLNQDSRLHLTGGGSMYSFFAYYTKNVLHAKSLPLKLFSLGRQYNPIEQDSINLFNASQASVVQFFSACKNSEESDMTLVEVMMILKDFYEKCGVHFHLVLTPANDLMMWEALRLKVEMFSGSLNKYVEVANISVAGDFISKRLMFQYTEEQTKKFPHVLSGTLLNIPKFLSCFIEQNNSFNVPEIFKHQNW